VVEPAVERQAIDRTHRIGQTRPVTAYRMVTAGSVEEKIRALAERKSALSRSVIKADSAIAKSLTKDDLEFLFADPRNPARRTQDLTPGLNNERLS